jgi:alkylglycerol monooxygenase
VKLNPIAVAVPLFFASMAIEGVIAKRRGLRLYRLDDSIACLSCGVSQQLVTVLFAGIQLAIYTAVYQVRFFDLPIWGAALLAFFGVDFLYYWWHRLSHEVNLFWAAHIVHHSSEEFNLAVALRQSVSTSWTGLPFYLPLALLGVPPLYWGTALALSTLYQFWIHTELVPRLSGPLDWIFNLPSHHRVHHAINPHYLDKNYGATLILWDRLFGTYAPETTPCVYGITKPLGSFRLVRTQLHHFGDLVARTWRSKSIRHWWKPPAWTPEGMLTVPEVSRDRYVKFERKVSPRWLVPVFVVVVLATWPLMQFGSQVPLAIALVWIGSLLVVLEGIGWVMER